MSVTWQDFHLCTNWEVGPEKAKNPLKWGYVDPLLKDTATGRLYWNQEISVVRFKSCALTIVTPFVQVPGSIINIAYRICKLVTGAHFWVSKEGERKYSVVDRSADAAIDILRIIATPLSLIAMEFAAIYGIFSPRNGTKLYATLQRANYGTSGKYFAWCFQPVLSKYIIKPGCLSQRELEKIKQKIHEKELSFIRRGLAEIPKEILQLTTLNRLMLYGNNLTQLPEGPQNLKSIRVLEVTSNELAKLPDWVLQLETLEELWLENNRLTELPEGEHRLTSLKFLSLTNNELTELPKWMEELTSLKQLYLRDNNLTRFPEGLKGLGSLEYLDLSGNDLTEIPDWIQELTSLNKLLLRGNKIEELPTWIMKFAKNCEIHL